MRLQLQSGGAEGRKTSLRVVEVSLAEIDKLVVEVSREPVLQGRHSCGLNH